MNAGRTRVDPRLQQQLRLAEHAANLTRLCQRVEMLRRNSERRFGLHLRAALMAYDQTLALAAVELGICVPGKVPWEAADRLTVEAELSLAGLRW
jgi:hypothetical protein